MFDIIVAVDKNGGIGKAGALPWHLSEDLRHFKMITTATKSAKKKNAVIMGRKTWESIPEKFRPLPGRINLVLTKNRGYALPRGVAKAESLEAALKLLNSASFKKKLEQIFVIGGGQVFETALKNKQCRYLHLTHIEKDFHCDAFFPKFRRQFHRIFISPSLKQGSLPYHFAICSRSMAV